MHKTLLAIAAALALAACMPAGGRDGTTTPGPDATVLIPTKVAGNWDVAVHKVCDQGRAIYMAIGGGMAIVENAAECQSNTLTSQ
jgi:hypothetical protein